MKPVPYGCPVCREKDETFYGRLVWPDRDEPPFLCPNHPVESPVELVPADKLK
jgi:hypothetical protein